MRRILGVRQSPLRGDVLRMMLKFYAHLQMPEYLGCNIKRTVYTEWNEPADERLDVVVAGMAFEAVVPGARKMLYTFSR